MDYIPLGRSGLQISRLVLGCSTFGELVDEAGVREIVDRADALGISTFDTANVYAGGESETLLGRALKGRRNRFVICSKVGHRVGDGEAEHLAARNGRLDHAARWRQGISPNDRGLSRLQIVRACEDSLRRLQTDAIDLYQVHGWDPTTPIEETLRALDDLVRAGKVRYIGASGMAAWQLVRALWVADRSATVGFSAMQVMFNLLLREPERELLPACKDSGVGVLAYSALAAGFLTGRHTPAGGLAAGSLFAARRVYQDTYWNEANHERLRRLREWPPGQGQSVAQLALAWVLSHPAVTAAIVGCQHAAELDELVAVNRLSGALHAELTACVG